MISEKSANAGHVVAEREAGGGGEGGGTSIWCSMYIRLVFAGRYGGRVNVGGEGKVKDCLILLTPHQVNRVALKGQFIQITFLETQESFCGSAQFAQYVLERK